MKIKELIQLLEKVPQDKDIVVSAGWGIYFPVNVIDASLPDSETYRADGALPSEIVLRTVPVEKNRTKSR
jgi:hypothetical protein